jgi:hypothetical protein
MEEQKILLLDISKELDFLFTRAFSSSEYILDRSGSWSSGVHKIRNSPYFLVAMENKEGVSPREVVGVLKEIRERSLPLLLISPFPIPEERRSSLSAYLSLLEPPIYPSRIFREVELFRSMEDTIYMFRRPQKTLKGVYVWFLENSLLPEKTAKVIKEGLIQNGVRMVSVSSYPLLYNFVEGHAKGLVVFPSRGEVDSDRAVVEKVREISSGIAFLLLLPPSECVPQKLYSYLNIGVEYILPFDPHPQDWEKVMGDLRVNM